MSWGWVAYWSFLGFCVSFSVAFTWLNWRTWRQYQALNALLLHLCLQAWAMRRWPLIEQWLTFAELELRVEERRGDD